MRIAEINVNPQSKMIDAITNNVAVNIYDIVEDYRRLTDNYTLKAYEVFSPEFITEVLESLYTSKTSIQGKFNAKAQIYSIVGSTN